MREKMADELFNIWAESQVNDICANFLRERLKDQNDNGEMI